MDKLIGKKSQRFLNGKLHISIKCYPTSFEITLTTLSSISKGSKLKEKNEKALISFVTKANVAEGVSISRTISYKKDSDGNIKAPEIKISYTKSGVIRGFLIVSPEFYLPYALFQKAQNIEIAKQDFTIVIHEKHPRPSASKFVPYITSHPNRPYQG